VLDIAVVQDVGRYVWFHNNLQGEGSIKEATFMATKKKAAKKKKKH